MDEKQGKFSERLTSFLSAIGSIVKEVWNGAGVCGFCCGIRLDRQERDNDMPTPGSCCGVRV